MSKRSVLALGIAALLAAAVWAASVSFTGQREPWDAEGGFYLSGLLLAGLLAGAIVPRPLWAHYVGGIVGQLAYMLLFLGGGPLVGLGAILMAIFSLVLLLGALAGSRLRLALQ
jgi:hypothetical protein